MSDDVSTSNVSHTCSKCKSSFQSRNQLFKHLKSCGKQELIPKPQNLPFSYVDFDSELLKYTIYVTGGRLRGRTLGSVEKFSFLTNKWELSTPLLENRGSHGAIAVLDNIYVIGGGGFDSNLATCETMNIHTGKWEYIQPTTIYRHALVLTSIQLSDISTTTSVNTNREEDQIDISTSITVNTRPNNTCIQATTAPCTNEDVNTTSNTTTTNTTTSNNNNNNNNKKWYIYAIGGWIDGKLCSRDVERYDVTLNTWHTCTPMSVARRLLGATSYQHYLYTFGGNCDDGIWYTAAVERYDTYTDTWTRMTDLPHPGPASACTIGDFIYVFCHGYKVYQYDPLQDSYLSTVDLPVSEWYTFDVTTCGPYIFCHGGAIKGIWSKSMYVFDIRNYIWKQYPDMLRQRRRCAAAIVKTS